MREMRGGLSCSDFSHLPFCRSYTPGPPSPTTSPLQFWSIRVEGTSTVVEYGAKGTKPRDTTKDHGTEAAAQAFVGV